MAVTISPIMPTTVLTVVARPLIQRVTRLEHELSGGCHAKCDLLRRLFGDARGWYPGYLLVRSACAALGGVR